MGKKTNAARILDRGKIAYDLVEYAVDESELGAEHVAESIGQDLERVFETIVLKGDKTGVVVAVVPGNAGVNLKALAGLSGNKKILPLPLKEVQPITGYIRGGCSPVGMKKQYPTFIDQSAENFEKIYISAGVRGMQFCVNPFEIIKLTNAKVGAIADKNEQNDD
ncbi:MAG: Cys-tRNA(Pro) deacylase [Bacteroidales bacterium]|nr:Cys-tRNA(Pro) deacylase [Bacteroidales bacterium]